MCEQDTDTDIRLTYLIYFSPNILCVIIIHPVVLNYMIKKIVKPGFLGLIISKTIKPFVFLGVNKALYYILI